MRKIYVYILSIALTAALSAAAFAAQGPSAQGGSNGAQQQEAAQQRREEFANKREEFNAFREQLRQCRTAALDSMRFNNQLRAENARLLGEAKGSLEQMREQGIEISEETMEAIHAYMEQIRVHKADLKETHFRMREIAEDNGELRSEKDYASLVDSFGEISDIQQQRTETLNKINECISEILKLLVSEA